MGPIKLGNILIQRVLECEEPFLPAVEMFPEVTPEALEPHRHWLEPDALCPATGKFILAFQSYLLRTPRHTILIDTCVGCDKSHDWYKPWHKRKNRIWLANLLAVGVTPAQIDYVLCTHLHTDHSGWNTRLVNGQWQPTFPNAQYVFSRREYEHSRSQASTTYLENVAPIVDAGRAVLVDMDYALSDEVWLEPTPGHTPGHVAVRMSSGGQQAVMCGDLMHSPVQCKHPEWTTAFDDSPDLARKTRRAFLDANCDSDTVVLTAHFPSPSVGHVIAKDGAFEFTYS